MSVVALLFALIKYGICLIWPWTYYYVHGSDQVDSVARSHVTKMERNKSNQGRWGSKSGLKKNTADLLDEGA